MSYHEPTTRPTIETLFKMMREVRDEMRAGFGRIELRLEKVEEQLDRVTSVAHETRADLRELKKDLREHFPAVKYVSAEGSGAERAASIKTRRPFCRLTNFPFSPAATRARDRRGRAGGCGRRTGRLRRPC